MRKVAAMLGKRVKLMDAIRGVQGRHEELILNRTIDFQKDRLLLIDKEHWSKGVQERWVARIVSFEKKGKQDIIQYNNLVGKDNGTAWLQARAKPGSEPMTANTKTKPTQNRRKAGYAARIEAEQDEVKELHRQLQQAIQTTNSTARGSTSARGSASEESDGGDGGGGEEMDDRELPGGGGEEHMGTKTTPRTQEEKEQERPREWSPGDREAEGGGARGQARRGGEREGGKWVKGFDAARGRTFYWHTSKGLPPVWNEFEQAIVERAHAEVITGNGAKGGSQRGGRTGRGEGGPIQVRYVKDVVRDMWGMGGICGEGVRSGADGCDRVGLGRHCVPGNNASDRVGPEPHCVPANGGCVRSGADGCDRVGLGRHCVPGNNASDRVGSKPHRTPFNSGGGRISRCSAGCISTAHPLEL
jgi:hypothetical protein